MYLIDSPWFFGFLIDSEWIWLGFWEIDEELEKEKEEKEKEKEDNKIGVAEKVSTIAMLGAGLLLLFWGLQRGYPFVDLFSCFFLVRVL